MKTTFQEKLCPRCGGDKEMPDEDGDGYITCPECLGDGVILREAPSPLVKKE